MKKIIMTCLVALLLAGPAYAGKEEKIQEIIDLFNLDALSNEMDKQIIDPIECSFVLNITERANVKKQLKEILDVKDIVTRLGKDFYNKNFTEAEIDDVLAFYKTPTGKKTISLLPQLGQYINKEMIPYMQKTGPKLEAFAQELQRKYKTRSQFEIRACMSKKANQ